MRILIVDDEQDICEILQYNLETDGYEVVTANSAEEALELPLYRRDAEGSIYLDFDVDRADAIMTKLRCPHSAARSQNASSKSSSSSNCALPMTSMMRSS